MWQQDASLVGTDVFSEWSTELFASSLHSQVLFSQPLERLVLDLAPALAHLQKGEETESFTKGGMPLVLRMHNIKS